MRRNVNNEKWKSRKRTFFPQIREKEKQGNMFGGGGDTRNTSKTSTTNINEAKKKITETSV